MTLIAYEQRSNTIRYKKLSGIYSVITETYTTQQLLPVKKPFKSIVLFGLNCTFTICPFWRLSASGYKLTYLLPKRAKKNRNEFWRILFRYDEIIFGWPLAMCWTKLRICFRVSREHHNQTQRKPEWTSQNILTYYLFLDLRWNDNLFLNKHVLAWNYLSQNFISRSTYC